MPIVFYGKSAIINNVKREETPRLQVVVNLCNLPKPQKNKKKSKTLLTNIEVYGIIQIQSREKQSVAPSAKKNSKKFEKTLDKTSNLWYNKYRN